MSTRPPTKNFSSSNVSGRIEKPSKFKVITSITFQDRMTRLENVFVKLRGRRRFQRRSHAEIFFAAIDFHPTEARRLRDKQKRPFNRVGNPILTNTLKGTMQMTIEKTLIMPLQVTMPLQISRRYCSLKLFAAEIYWIFPKKTTKRISLTLKTGIM